MFFLERVLLYVFDKGSIENLPVASDSLKNLSPHCCDLGSLLPLNCQRGPYNNVTGELQVLYVNLFCLLFLIHKLELEVLL